MSHQLYHEFGVTLERRSNDLPWGIRLAGGSDLNSPLIIIRVQENSPANKELMRGDVITKVEDYDARDLRHEDAQLLFRTQDNKIRLVVRRDNKIAMNSSKANPISSLPPPEFTPTLREPYVPQRAPSPLPRGPHSFAAAIASPIDSLPHTTFPNGQQYQQQQQQYQPYQPYQSAPEQKPEQHVNYPPPPPPRSCFSPQLTRDSYQTVDDENSAIQNQPYRTTPLILPGAKNNLQKNLPTESYLRHHPNPQMRGPPTHDFTDILMKQKVADSVLHRVVGDNSAQNGPKVVHKQFNSPIGLYSDNLIENTIKNTVSPPQSVASNSSVPIFIDFSFLEQKKKILEQQEEIQRQKQQSKTNFGFSPKPQFNRAQNYAPPPQPQLVAITKPEDFFPPPQPQAFQKPPSSVPVSKIPQKSNFGPPPKPEILQKPSAPKFQPAPPSSYPPAYYPNSRFSFNQ